jgi:branched-chain amino acid transport system substrate-binding protein
MNKTFLYATAFATALIATPATSAEIRIGVILPQTGSSAGSGIPQARAVSMLPTKVGADTVRYFVMDDGGDPTKATQAAKQLFENDKVDALIGPTATPSTMAIQDLIRAYGVPVMTLSGASVVIEPIEKHK